MIRDRARRLLDDCDPETPMSVALYRSVAGLLAALDEAETEVARLRESISEALRATDSLPEDAPFGSVRSTWYAAGWAERATAIEQALQARIAPAATPAPTAPGERCWQHDWCSGPYGHDGPCVNGPWPEPAPGERCDCECHRPEPAFKCDVCLPAHQPEPAP